MNVEPACEQQTLWASKNFEKVKTIIFAGAWTRYLDLKLFKLESRNVYEIEISQMIKSMLAQKKKVVFFDQIPLCSELDGFYGRRFSLKNLFMNEAEERQKVTATCGVESEKANKHFKTLVEKNGVKFISTLADFQKQVGPMPFYENLYLYKDGGHLNQEGAVFLGKWAGKNSETFKDLFQNNH